MKHILYVDDDPDLQTIVRIALEKIGGYALKICSSGMEALQEAPAFRPDMILLDVMMPEMDGPTTMKALRQIPQASTTPVVFMTAKVQTHEVSHYESLGAAGIITKPFDPLALPATLQSIWKRVLDGVEASG